MLNVPDRMKGNQEGNLTCMPRRQGMERRERQGISRKQ